MKRRVLKEKQRQRPKKEKPGSGSGSLFFGGAMFGVGGIMMILRPIPYFQHSLFRRSGLPPVVYPNSTMVGMGVFLLLISLALFYVGYLCRKD
jgi:hypothetical protein